MLFNDPDSTFRGEIYHQATDMGMEFPRNLWHAAILYLRGRATREALAKADIDHEMLMDALNIFADFKTPEFKW